MSSSPVLGVKFTLKKEEADVILNHEGGVLTGCGGGAALPRDLFGDVLTPRGGTEEEWAKGLEEGSRPEAGGPWGAPRAARSWGQHCVKEVSVCTCCVWVAGLGGKGTDLLLDMAPRGLNRPGLGGRWGGDLGVFRCWFRRGTRAVCLDRRGSSFCCFWTCFPKLGGFGAALLEEVTWATPRV